MNDKDIAVVKNAAKKNGFRYDPSSPFKKIKELKSQGVDAYFNFTVKRFSPDLVPLGSLPRKTLVLCNELGPYRTSTIKQIGTDLITQILLGIMKILIFLY